MTTAVEATERSLLWSHEALGLHALADSAGSVRLGAPGQDWTSLLPLVEVTATGHGRIWSGERFIDTAIGDRLTYRGHETLQDGDWQCTTIRLADPATGLAADITLRTCPGAGFLRSQVRLVNEGSTPLRLESVSSLALGGIVDAMGALDGLTLHWADNDWLAECRWRHAVFRDHVVPLNRSAHGHEGRGCFERCSQGSWSTGRHLPIAALTDRTGRAWLWQIESSAGWRYETGEREGAVYLALFGPDDAHHQWRETVAPGQEFTTVPAVLVGAETGGLDAVFGELTAYRRRMRRSHQDHTALPVIYNDYMNTLMGDPTTDKLLPLIEAAGAAGAEVFVIDAGWYDDDAQGWWDAVGAWEASGSRFPGGIQKVLDAIREHGMTPGLWLEPEVVGVRSPLARTLPSEAFFRRGGVRVTEHGRHHLDLRHPAARAHLDQVVDRLVGDWGVGYLKFDYNINIGPGTENGAESAGAGLLGHHRAHLDWLGCLLDRYPGLVLENCASGGLRMDYAQLAVVQLQSTSDQQDPLRYPPIAAAAATAVTPEQAAVWAYPQPHFSPDEIAFTLTGALPGRIHLSGFLDRMSPEQFELVRSGISVYKAIRSEIPDSLPFWPLGLPSWEDTWIASGWRGHADTWLALWRREAAAGEREGGPRSRDQQGADESSCTVTISHLRGARLRPRLLYPATSDATASWDAADGQLTVSLPRPNTAVLLCLSAVPPAEGRQV
ncbi:alpha-galactosidase [Streptomyces sp. SP18BB07]|uniref:alpha-galactosidase n=1 Tax=Streptomyces sp. SP18BB07 TaxID=3002522 RepID=UPI002E79CB92|nr:alpha-galactosidase [Streptomyces sp. SP18BB07]MEE1765119.1 alpha-galactosidase [Streptomyces sp. SP18BB07]